MFPNLFVSLFKFVLFIYLLLLLTICSYCCLREALRLAFGVLEKDGHINFRDFLLLMAEYHPRIRECWVASHTPQWTLLNILSSPSIHLLPIAEYQVLCIFKALQKGQEDKTDTTHIDHGISLEDFYNFYEIQNMKWRRVGTCSGCGRGACALWTWADGCFVLFCFAAMTVPGWPRSEMVCKFSSPS